MTCASLCHLLFAFSLAAFFAASRSGHLKKVPHLATLKTNTKVKVPIFNTFVETCRDANKSGIYTTYMHHRDENIHIRCEVGFFGGGWTVLQRRHEGVQDFRQSWARYVKGFGDLQTEFWYGLEKIQALTALDDSEMLIVIENAEKMRSYALYKRFKLAQENNNYAIIALGVYSGEAGDSMLYHLNMPFSTMDHKNNAEDKADCSMRFGYGGWWYNDCYMSNINGMYPKKEQQFKVCRRCMSWTTFVPDRPLIFTQMMIRPTLEENWE